MTKVSAAPKGTLKVISKESDDFIFEEIYRHNALKDLEYNYNYKDNDDNKVTVADDAAEEE